MCPWSMYCCTACLDCINCSGMCACLPALCCWRWIAGVSMFRVLIVILMACVCVCVRACVRARSCRCEYVRLGVVLLVQMGC